MSETIDAVVDRLNRCGDRYRACDDRDGEEQSSTAAQAASVAATPEAARTIELDFYHRRGIVLGKSRQPIRKLEIVPLIRPSSFVTGDTVQAPLSLTDVGDPGVVGGDIGGGDVVGGDGAGGDGDAGNGNGADEDDAGGGSFSDDS